MKKTVFLIAALVAALVFLGGCAYYYTVKPNDTIYSIAKKYGVSQKALMRINGIKNPRKLQIGQELRIPHDAESSQNVASSDRKKDKTDKTKDDRTRKTIDKTKRDKIAPPPPPPARPQFIWPVKGVILRTYGKGGDGRINDGLDIGAPEGATIVAAGAGEVIVASNKLPSYGNMIVIKHNNDLVTLYAHNRVNYVSKGMKVKQGQKIAEVGSTGSRITTPMIHFEVRILTEPVNPYKYLPQQ